LKIILWIMRLAFSSLENIISYSEELLILRSVLKYLVTLACA
jgi:hypothetical protein